MSKRVLVPIKSYRQFEDLLPYLEDVTRPGVQIIFLVHFGASRFAQLAGLLLEMQSGLPGNLYSDPVVKQSHFTHRIEFGSQALCNRGVRIDVRFYSGRLQPILRQCIKDDDHLTVIMRPAVTRPRRWLASIFAALRTGNPSRAIPVLLCYPSHLTRRSS